MRSDVRQTFIAMRINYTDYQFNRPTGTVSEEGYRALRAIPSTEFELDLAASIERERLAFVGERMVEYNLMRFGMPFLGLAVLLMLANAKEDFVVILCVVGMISLLGRISFAMSYQGFCLYLRKKKAFYSAMKRNADGTNLYDTFSRL